MNTPKRTGSADQAGVSGGDFFLGLPEDREAFLRICHSDRYAKGGFPFLQGDPDQRVFYVDEGEVKIIRVSPCGRESIISLRHPGELFGVAEAMTGQTRRASAQAVTALSVHHMQGLQFKGFLEQYPRVAVRVGELMSYRLRDLCEQVETLMVCDPISRLIKLLLIMVEQSGVKRGETLRIPLPLSQTELAAMIGSSRQTVNQILRLLQGEDLIHATRSEITILHYDALLARWAATHADPICCATCLAAEWPSPSAPGQGKPRVSTLRPADRLRPS